MSMPLLWGSSLLCTRGNGTPGLTLHLHPPLSQPSWGTSRGSGHGWVAGARLEAAWLGTPVELL